MRISDFDYNLPKELIAQSPIKERDGSRLLVLHRDTGRIEHRIFRDIVNYLSPNDTLILNNTKVLPARLAGRKETGGKVDALILNLVTGHRPQVGNEYEALLKPVRGCRIGNRIVFGGGEFCAEITRIENGRRFLRFDAKDDLEKLLDRSGQMPLPPYMKREPADYDMERYQTVYASKKGAIAAPTAGLHFTKNLLREISKKGVDIEYVTLHVGYGTFKPVSAGNIKEHKMEKEYFEIENKAIERLSNKKGRVVAVGTTSARVLETIQLKAESCQLSAERGWTDLFIYPGYKFKLVECLLTNFHLPKTTLLMLVAAFCGRGLMFKAYEEAIKEKYRFYSYGDAMLII